MLFLGGKGVAGRFIPARLGVPWLSRVDVDLLHVTTSDMLRLHSFDLSWICRMMSSTKPEVL